MLYVIERVYSFTLFGTVIQCNLKLTAHVDQTILAVIYNQSRMTNKSRYLTLKFAATVTKRVNPTHSFSYRVNEINRANDWRAVSQHELRNEWRELCANVNDYCKMVGLIKASNNCRIWSTGTTLIKWRRRRRIYVTARSTPIPIGAHGWRPEQVAQPLM